jgi:hypothetical protein
MKYIEHLTANVGEWNDTESLNFICTDGLEQQVTLEIFLNIPHTQSSDNLRLAPPEYRFHRHHIYWSHVRAPRCWLPMIHLCDCE